MPIQLISFWCSLVEAKGPIIFMETCLVVVVVSNHNFACTKEHPRIAQLGLIQVGEVEVSLKNVQAHLLFYLHFGPLLKVPNCNTITNLAKLDNGLDETVMVGEDNKQQLSKNKGILKLSEAFCGLEGLVEHLFFFFSKCN